MSARWRRLGLVAGWSALVAWFPMSAYLTTDAQAANGGDFGMYYAAAESLRFSPHADLYSPKALAAAVLAHGGCGPPPLIPYPYQPLLAMLLEPLTFIPCSQAALIWMSANFTLWVGIAGALAYLAWMRHGAARALAVAAIVLVFRPALSGIYLGQVHLALLVCMLAGAALITRKREYMGGAALGLGVMLKYLPVVMVAYYLLRGRWRVAVGAGIISLALGALEYVAVGPRTLFESLSAGASDIRYYAAANQHGHWMSALPGGVAIAYTCGVLLAALALWTWRRPVDLVGAKRESLDRLGAFWAVVTGLLVSPLLWWFYATWILPAFLVAFDLLLSGRDRSRGARSGHMGVYTWLALLALGASYGIMLVPVTTTEVAIGLLIVWLVCGALYLRAAGARWPGGWRVGWRWEKASRGADPTEASGVGAVSP